MLWGERATRRTSPAQASKRVWPSQWTQASWEGSKATSITLLSLTVMGRYDKACGQSGTIAMPFELILRAAAVLGRNDPLTFVMQFTRAYNPELWKTLESLGVGQLVVQGAREREFANLYRAHDAGRQLSDAEFADALAFVNASWELALAFKRHRPARTAKAAKSTARAKADGAPEGAA